MKKTTKSLNNQKGLATIESVVLLVVFMVISVYSMGFFGVIHTGIKNSIAARTLTFETFRNRPNLKYRRDNINPGEQLESYASKGFRSHQITHENTPTGPSSPMWATDRKIAMLQEQDYSRSTIEAKLPPQLETAEANPVFIKTKYGICLNANCGDGR